MIRDLETDLAREILKAKQHQSEEAPEILQVAWMAVLFQSAIFTLGSFIITCVLSSLLNLARLLASIARLLPSNPQYLDRDLKE